RTTQTVGGLGSRYVAAAGECANLVESVRDALVEPNDRVPPIFGGCSKRFCADSRPSCPRPGTRRFDPPAPFPDRAGKVSLGASSPIRYVVSHRLQSADIGHRPNAGQPGHEQPVQVIAEAKVHRGLSPATWRPKRSPDR